MEEPLRVLVIGGGGVGGYFGAKLARVGHEVSVVDRGEHLATMRRDQRITVRPDGGEPWSASVRALETTAELDHDPDLLIWAVKGPDNESAIEQLAHVKGFGTLLTLQNGIDLHEALLAKYGDTVLWGVARIGSHILEPGVIRHLYLGDIIIGEPRGGTTERTKLIRTVFRGAGVPCRVSTNMVSTLWEKLIWNSAFNMIASLVEQDIGGCLANPSLRQLLLDTMLESITVARAHGVDMPDSVAAELLDASADLPKLRTSMLTDRMKGVPTEADLFGGSIVRRGIALGIPTPLNATLSSLHAGLGPKNSR